MKRRSWREWLLGGLMLWAAAPAAWALDVPLKYVKFPERDREGGWTRERFPRSLRFNGGRPDDFKLPPGRWKLPKLVDKHPIYYQLDFGGEKRLMIFDCKDEKDKNYTRLYLDANGNQDLTDDPPIDGEHQKKGGWSYQGNDYPIVECTLKVQGKSRPYAFQLVLQQLDMWKKRHSFLGAVLGQAWWLGVGLGQACWYAGECKLAGQRYRVALYDANLNGRFDEFGSLPPAIPNSNERLDLSGDRLYLYSADSQVDWYDGVPLCNRVSIGGKVYNVTVNMKKPRLTLTETKDKLVGIRIPQGTQQLVLVSEKGDRTLTAVRPGERLNVPEGRYRVVSYSGNYPDADGNVWGIAAAATPGTPVMAADPTADNPLKIGAPFTARASVPPGWGLGNLKGSRPAPRQVMLEFACRDAGDRELTTFALSQVNGKKTYEESAQRPGMPKEPTYEIFTGDGKKVASGTFEYG